MLHSLKLLLPVFFPSWRFFDVIAPSPRLEICFLKNEKSTPQVWQEFRSRPDRVGFLLMLGRMFWNPVWNETLFLVSLYERLMADLGQRTQICDEISKRIQIDLKGSVGECTSLGFFQFRLVFVSREGSDMCRDVTFVSPVYACEAGAGL